MVALRRQKVYVVALFSYTTFMVATQSVVCCTDLTLKAGGFIVHCCQPHQGGGFESIQLL